MALKNAPAKASSPSDQLMVGFKEDLANITPYLEALLPKAMVPRFLRMAQLAVMRDGKLLEATKKSLLLSLLWCAQRGLEPGVEDGCWLIPFKGKVTPIPGFKGLIAKAIEVGAALSVDAFAVFENDDFFYAHGLEPDLRHTPPRLGDSRGELVGVYSVITLPNGEKKFRVMDRADVERIRGMSAAWKNAPNSGPWEDHFEAMALKTVIKQGLKTVPMREELRDLLSDDGMIEAGGTVGALLAGAGTEVPNELAGADDMEAGQDAASAAQAKIEQDKKDTAEFDGLVQSELASLTATEAQARLLHLEENLKISAKGTKSCKGSIVAFKKLAAPLFYPYMGKMKDEAGKEVPVQKEGYWKTFLTWEATNYPPAPESGVQEGAKEAGGGDGDPGAAVEPGAIITFEDRSKTLAMEILKHPIPMADLEITGLSEITPENIDDMEARVKAWKPPKKK